MSSTLHPPQKRRSRQRESSLEAGGVPPSPIMATTPPSDADDSREAASASSEEPLLPVHDETVLKHVRTKKQPIWKKYWKHIAAVATLVVVLILLIVWFTTNQKDDTLEEPEEPLIVTLPGYGTLKGTQVVKSIKKKDAFEEPINAWLGIEYSIQPGNNTRFAPPDWPKPFNETIDASEYGPACMQNWGFDPNHQSEACLTFNLFRPAGISFDTKLPVFVFLHGGAFVGGSSRSFDGATFVARSQEPLIVVTAQYRLGILGSLPSKLFEEEGLLNLGLRDQRMMLEFIQKYVTHFGGDPDRVTLGGQSAGAHSVGIHLFHSYGGDENKKLFSQAVIASGGPTARSFPPSDYPLYQRQFNETMDYLRCDTSLSNADQIACLNDAPLRSMQQISAMVYKQNKYNITWPWQPVSPGALMEKRGTQSGVDGTFYKIPLLISSTTDEGKFFTPKNLTTNEDFTDFVATLLPGLNDDDLADLDALYPDPTNDTGPYSKSHHIGKWISTQFDRIGAAYGDYSYICPVQEAASRLAGAGAPVYKARFNTPNGAPPHMGIPHASDAAYFNGGKNVQFPEISEIYSAYYASFVVSGDPNKYKTDDAPTWDRYYGVGSGELVVSNEDRGGIVMEEERAGVRMVECKWWRDEDRASRLFK